MFLSVQLSCLFDPTLDIKYLDGIVTKVFDTNKCMINDKYVYQPKTPKEILDFSDIDVDHAVRLSMYKKKNSIDEWKISSCFLSEKGSCHAPNMYSIIIECNNLKKIYIVFDFFCLGSTRKNQLIIMTKKNHLFKCLT